MMKIIKKVGSLVAIFILTIYNTCFADVVMTKKDIKSHGMYRRDLVEPETESVNYILIGILVLVVVVCTVIIIRRIIKKKKEKENDNK